jgi:hypothetical protein
MTKLTAVGKDQDDNGVVADIRFRESESQINAEAVMINDAISREANVYYESFI